MASLITGEVEAVSWKNRSFKLQDGEWFKLSADVEVDIKDVKKGVTVTLDYNPSTKEGRTTNWVNLIDIDGLAGNGHVEEEPAPAKTTPRGSHTALPRREEPPPIGAHATKDEWTSKDRKIGLLALHKTITPLCWNSGIEKTSDIWDVIEEHEREMNKRLGK